MVIRKWNTVLVGIKLIYTLFETRSLLCGRIIT